MKRNFFVANCSHGCFYTQNYLYEHISIGKIYIPPISLQVQKFAVRFPRLSDAESFLNSVKELSSNTMDIMPSGSDYIPSNGLQYRPDEAVSFEEPTSDHRTDAPAVGYHMEPDQPVLQSPIATNINSIYSGFPEGYSGFPEGYSGFAEGYSGSVKIERDGGPFPATITDHAPEKAYILDTRLDAAGGNSVADKGKGAGKEIDVSDVTRDILAGIETYVGDDSFHDMLSKLDKAIDELGGDMLLAS
uniref:Poor homologous synapsis 1 PH domain-containing protein n=1 Tax=Aegilops tauschii subsp. strangulata TaxID=200361 RepID=A0A453RH79_AEGTS